MKLLGEKCLDVMGYVKYYECVKGGNVAHKEAVRNAWKISVRVVE